jgi:hypothetical protein
MATAAGCGLDAAGLGEQASRYERLGAMASTIERLPHGLRISFSDEVDRTLVAEVAAVERDCCDFLTVEVDAAADSLLIGADARGAPVLDAIEKWLQSGRAQARGG